MANFFNAARKILKDYEYLNYKEIVELWLWNGSLHTDWKTPILTMSSRLWSDIRMKWNKSTFIRIWDWVFAVRRPLKEDNLLVYLKYRLKNFPFWQIDDKDEKYLLDIFWRNILADENIELLSLLKDLKKKNKIEDFNVVDWWIVINLRKEENKISEDLKKKIEILKNDADKIKALSDSINTSLWFSDLTKNINKVTEDLKVIVPQIIPGWLMDLNDETFKQFDKLQEVFSWIWKSPILENFSQILKWAQETLKLYDTSKLSTIQLIEFNKMQWQIDWFNQLMTNPEVFLWNIANQTLFNTTAKKLKKDKKSFAYSFRWVLHEWDFNILRWYANIGDLAKISEPIYFDVWWSQRIENKDRCSNIKNYIEFWNKRFIPEVTLWLYLKDNWAIEITKNKNWKYVLDWYINIDFDKLEKWQISRIDWNHRLYYWDKVKDNFIIPFSFVIFDQRWENIWLINEHKNQEANIFYLLNGKNEPVTSEEALQVLLNMPDDEAESLYQNDSTLWLTRICKVKYENYLKTCKDDTKRNFWDKVYTKFELLIKYVEKLWIENSKIDKLLDKVFSSINHLDEEYNAIISRDDFLYLVLNVVLDNEEKSSPKLNKLLKEFFDWILKEWLEDISSSEKPILWELFQKQKSFKETSDIHSYQINENKFNWEPQENPYKEFIVLINESRKKIILKDIEEKRVWLEKIVDAYSRLLDILWNWWTDNAWRVDKIIKRFFHSSDREKMKEYLKYDFYDNLWKRVMNNDFAIRHHETDKEKLEDKQFIEFLYCEYDNAIKFILGKAWFLI